MLVVLEVAALLAVIVLPLTYKARSAAK